MLRFMGSQRVGHDSVTKLNLKGPSFNSQVKKSMYSHSSLS